MLQSYKVNTEEKQMKESKPAIWNPDKAIEGVFCPTCGNWIDDYTGQPENCPKCGQKLSGWIDGRKHPPELQAAALLGFSILY
jgi:hypothetical protein